MPQELPDLLTPVTVPEMFSALGAAWRTKFGEEPRRASLLVLLSQWAEEDARGKAMHRFNAGNIKHTDGDGHDWCSYRCDEIIDGVRKWLEPPDPGCRFRAYKDLVEALLDYLDELTRRFHYAWPAVLAGDPCDFAKRLKVARYYTADEDKYEAALVSLFHEFDRTVPLEAPLAPNPQGGELLAIANGVDAGDEGLGPDTSPDTDRDPG